MLIDVAGSLLGATGSQKLVRAIEVEFTLPVEVRMSGSPGALVFCADVPSWRWRTDWDRPFGALTFKLAETSLELAQ